MNWYQCGDGSPFEGSNYDEPCVDCKPVVVIDPEDREAVERLQDLFADERDRNGGQSRLVVGGWADAMQAALRDYANPKPKREWRDGDVVQHVKGNYTAQRHNGKWLTTTSRGNAAWGDDDYVTLNVEEGFLRVLREQATE